ncbi:spore coat protein [Paenibacillus sp. GD4]|jgi:similar to spore coat protein|uniref:spore coat protein n=1 Tax=Paenibacillus TaxID=44249 RepID=UPI002542B689|nr:MULTISPECIES: spore coat protein [Paenibacillus]MDQ1911756.1 spore coat protein [Paenibacillus sp. GD4]
MEDYLDPRNSEGLPKQADSLFALDFLISAKSAVRNTAMVLAETATPDARAILKQQLDQAIALHEEISRLMIEKRWFHPYQVDEQFAIDLKAAQTTVEIAMLKLFPEDTARIGMFATPNK